MLTTGKTRKSVIIGFYYFFPLFAAVGLLTVSAAATYQRNEVWSSWLSLWTDATSKSPCKSRPFNSLGTVYANQGDYYTAIEKFQIAINNGSGSQEIHYLNLAQAYERLGRFQESVQSFHKSIAIKPDYAKAHYQLGLLYKTIGSLALAETELFKALSIAPGNDAYLNDLGNVYLLQKKYDRSAEQYKRSLEINPANLESLFNLALSLDESGAKEAAIMRYRQFIESAPAEYDLIKTRARQRISVLGQGRDRSK